MIARCNACGAEYERIDALYTHWSVRHSTPAKPADLPAYICDDCGAAYDIADSLRRHRYRQHQPQETHPQTSKATCTVCEAPWQPECSKHRWTTAEAPRDARHACRWCGKPYLYESGRIRHEAKEHPPAPVDRTLQAAREALS